MTCSEYKKDNELVAQQFCESYVPEYDILQLSKLYFINRTITENPFQTNFFICLDGGYGHGRDIYPKKQTLVS
ncbi:protein HtrL-like isoform X2 [Biomphalaria pfeifferi]|uniref:Protein HtrL-like isoform X2 n=1 Tax=Biomphalaria pfeifferi TaxID=112525 RepID=A0AAD8BXX0_BIOPF|nr:protein HtrL-like isoform X2 [Biomphalaria pfeifferi]